MIWYHSGGFVFAIKSEDTVGKSKHTWTALARYVNTVFKVMVTFLMVRIV